MIASGSPRGITRVTFHYVVDGKDAEFTHLEEDLIMQETCIVVAVEMSDKNYGTGVSAFMSIPIPIYSHTPEDVRAATEVAIEHIESNLPVVLGRARLAYENFRTQGRA